MATYMRGSGEMWFRIPRPLKQQLVAVAAEYEETQSAVVVRAIEHYLHDVLNLAPPDRVTLP